MSFLKRGINVLKGKVALLQEQESAADRQKIKELDKEMAGERSFPAKVEGSRGTPEQGPEPKEMPQKPLTPRDRTI